MRWFNFVGMGMLAFGIILNEWVYLHVSENFDLALVIGAVLYTTVALGLSLWSGPRSEAD
ncbi:MAG: hypothetical protein OEY28_13245 [Nitrospira sp.]|nr:hypothetical protein [Nitrospira sp.]